MSCVFGAAWFAAWLFTWVGWVSAPALADQGSVRVSAQVIDFSPCATAMHAIHERLPDFLSDAGIAGGDLRPAGGLLRIGFVTPPANHPDERLILIEFVAN
jgi:hypothetical protein